MSLSKPKEEERKTPAQWLKEGYVVRPNAEGKQVFYFKVNKWITVYSKKEVTREKRAVAKVEAELKRKTLALKYKYLDGTLVDQPKKFVIPTDENQAS